MMGFKTENRNEVLSHQDGCGQKLKWSTEEHQYIKEKTLEQVRHLKEQRHNPDE